ANYYLVQGRTNDALRQLQVVLRNTSEPLPPVLALAWRTTEDIQQVLAITPNQAQPLLDLLQVMMDEHRAEEGWIVWQRIAALHQWLNPQQVSSWIGFLITVNQPEEASQVWEQLLTTNPELDAYKTPANLVSNAGFERELLNGG